MGGKAVITTRGLEWDVQSWETEIGGRVSTSNRIAEGIEVVHIESTAGVLFTVHIYDDDE
jgi:thiamine pyrophosphokinase